MELSIIDKCELTLKELTKFSETLLELREPINDDRLIQFERELGFELPVDFMYFLTRFNGFSLRGTEVFGLGEHYKEASLDRIYEFEHFNVSYKMPKHFLPFSNDGQGNHYCLDLSRINSEKICPVIFWQWDFDYESLDDVETCNENFCDWVKEVMINWTLEDYNYDGSEK